VEIERVDSVGGLFGEVAHSLAQPVADRELVALCGEFGLVGFELAAAPVDLGRSPVELFHVDVAGLVEVGDAPALGGCLVDSALDLGELGGEQLVVGGGLARNQCLLAGEQRVGA